MKTKALVVLALSIGLVAAAYAAPAAPAKTGKTTVGEFAVRIATVLGTEEPNAGRAAEALKARGVETLIHYPVPIPRQPALSATTPAMCPIADQVCSQVVSLPMYPGLSDQAVAAVAEAASTFGG